MPLEGKARPKKRNKGRHLMPAQNRNCLCRFRQAHTFTVKLWYHHHSAWSFPCGRTIDINLHLSVVTMENSNDPLAPPPPDVEEEGPVEHAPEPEENKTPDTGNTTPTDDGRIYLWLSALVACVGAIIIVVVVLVVGGDDDDDSSSGKPLNTLPEVAFPPVPDVDDPQTQLDMILAAVQAEPVTSPILSVLPTTVAELEAQAAQGSTDPYIKAAAWVVLDDEYNKENQIVERFALAAIYHSTKGEGWIETENWLTPTSFCDAWHGVKCCSHFAYGGQITCNGKDPDHLSEMDLQQNNLDGEFPLAIALLKDLHSLRLAWNDLTGPLDGAIIAGLPDLSNLYIQHNRLTGPFDPALVANGVLTTFYVQGNFFEGEFPQEYCDVIEVYHLDCERNGCPCGEICAVVAETEHLRRCSDLGHWYDDEEDGLGG